MLRRILLSGVLAGAILAVSLWSPVRKTVVAQDAHPSGPDKKSAYPAPVLRAIYENPNGERRVVQSSSATSVPSYRSAQRRELSGDPIVIPAGRLRLIDLEDVPSQRDGVLMFIGTEIKEGQQVLPHEVVEVQIGEEKKRFRRLKEGDTVQGEQLLALVDDTLARAEVGIKTAKLGSAKADLKVSEKTRDEANERWNTQKSLYGVNATGLRATTREDLRGAKLTYEKYVEEVVSKVEAIKVAEQELNQANKTLTMYEVRPKVSGVVKAINKHRGEAIKSLEPLLQIQNYERLRVDALLPEQYANRLEKGMEVFVEPTYRESPRQTFIGHRGTVTAVAVSKDPRKIVSCSDDRTVRVWELPPGESRVREHILKRPERAAPFQSVACTSRDASVNLCLAGDRMGKGFLWDLNDLASEPRELKGHHQQAITSVAFSADGKSCATGGQDRQIMIWDTASGKLRDTISEHHNVVTALYFVPGERLISVSRDPSVRIWELRGDSHKEAKNGFIQRREPVMVDALGVSLDGQHMMDEQLGEMRVVTVPNAENAVPKTEGLLRPNVPGTKFANFALFSPDGQLALTTPEKEGMLQLWHIDFNQGRSYELRQFVLPAPGAVASAAFAPDGSFVVGAVNDRVYLWLMPAKDEVDTIPATITNVEKPIENAMNRVKVTAELENPGQRLRPGDVVTMVAYPRKK